MSNNIPPNSIELEESVIASILLYSGESNIALDTLEPEDFYKTAHKNIFRSIKLLYDSKVEIDLVSIVEIMKDQGILEESGGASYISKLMDNVPASGNIEYHCRKLKQKAALRRTIEICNAVAKRCFDDQSDPIETIDFFQQQANKISVDDTHENMAELRDLVLDAGPELDELYKNKGKVSGVPTGFGLFDYLTAGLQDTDLFVLAARPSMGKTALALNIIRSAAIHDIPSAIFSLEMGKRQLRNRIISGEANINTQKFRTGEFYRDDFDRIQAANKKIYKWPVIIDDTSGLSIMEMRRRARKYHKKYGIRLVVIDYLQLMLGNKAENRNLEIGTICQGLKGLAKDLELPVLLLSQLNRQLEKRPDKKPQLSDLRDSGTIEQDADVVTFIYRPEVYDLEPKFPGETEIIIAKQRNGPTGNFYLKWNETITRFFDVDYNVGGQDER